MSSSRALVLLLVSCFHAAPASFHAVSVPFLLDPGDTCKRIAKECFVLLLAPAEIIRRRHDRMSDTDAL
ncbi:unnamed protein product [Amoebophrya sp. A120]|nr:unnamed protein product [Amoebophrya sp. A120]|eukprot:GSA120T00001206001.1